MLGLSSIHVSVWNSFIHILQDCFTEVGSITWLAQCRYRNFRQNTTKHKPCAQFLEHTVFHTLGSKSSFTTRKSSYPLIASPELWKVCQIVIYSICVYATFICSLCSYVLQLWMYLSGSRYLCIIKNVGTIIGPECACLSISGNVRFLILHYQEVRYTHTYSTSLDQDFAWDIHEF